MFRNPWFTLVLGLMVGLVFGYVLAEQQSRAPGKSPQTGNSLRVAHRVRRCPKAIRLSILRLAPPINSFGSRLKKSRGSWQRTQMIPGLMAALGNVFFDAGNWADAKNWYEKSLAIDPVMSMCSPIWRSSIATSISPRRPSNSSIGRSRSSPSTGRPGTTNWSSTSSTSIKHDEAAAALRQLQELKKSNPEIPDLSALEAEVNGG